MRVFELRAVVPLLLLGAGCLPRPHQNDYGELARSIGVPASEQVAARNVAAEESGLEKEAKLAPIIRIALARNADLLEEGERVRERVARIAPAARLGDLTIKYEQWGVPLRRPYALGDADTLMLGVQQTFPAPGSLGAQERAAVADARAALQTLRARRLDVIREVERAYYEYVFAEREYRVHLEHVEITERMVELTRLAFRTGSVSEQDVLRIGVELQRLHRDIAGIQQRKRSSSALLNALMGRDTSAPLGPAPDLEPTEIDLSLRAAQTLAQEKRPEVMAGSYRIQRGKAGEDAASARATWPSFMVGLDYMLMPHEEERHAYGAMVAINLPWLNSRNREEARAAKHATVADQRALDSVRIALRYEVENAFARYKAARATYQITTDELLPTTRQSFEAAQAGFSAGRGNALALVDAMQSLLAVRLDQLRALMELNVAIAEVERAVGTDIHQKPIDLARSTPPITPATPSPGARP